MDKKNFNFEDIKEKILNSTNAENIKEMINKIDITKLDSHTLNHIQEIVGDNIENVKNVIGKIDINETVHKVRAESESIINKAKKEFLK